MSEHSANADEDDAGFNKSEAKALTATAREGALPDAETMGRGTKAAHWQAQLTEITSDRGNGNAALQKKAADAVEQPAKQGWSKSHMGPWVGHLQASIVVGFVSMIESAVSTYSVICH